MSTTFVSTGNHTRATGSHNLLESPDGTSYAADRIEYREDWETSDVNNRTGTLYMNVLYLALTVIEYKSIVFIVSRAHKCEIDLQ